MFMIAQPGSPSIRSQVLGGVDLLTMPIVFPIIRKIAPIRYDHLSVIPS